MARARRSATVCVANGMPGSISTSMRGLRPRRARRMSSIVSGAYCGMRPIITRSPKRKEPRQAIVLPRLRDSGRRGGHPLGSLAIVRDRHALWRGGQQSKQDDGYTATGHRQFQCRTPCRLASSSMYLQGIPPVSPGVNQTVSVASSLTARSDFAAIADSTRSAKTGKQTAATASQSSPLNRTLLM